MPIVAPLWTWLVGLLGSLFASFATWLMGRFVFERAVTYALLTAFLVASAALFLALTMAVKSAILGARVSMPQTLGVATFFLPGSIAQILSIIVTVRVSASVYRWTVNTMSAYIPHNPRTGLGGV